MEEEIIPFPNEEVTPPVTKIYFVFDIKCVIGKEQCKITLII